MVLKRRETKPTVPVPKAIPDKNITKYRIEFYKSNEKRLFRIPEAIADKGCWCPVPRVTVVRVATLAVVVRMMVMAIVVVM